MWAVRLLSGWLLLLLLLLLCGCRRVAWCWWVPECLLSSALRACAVPVPRVASEAAFFAQAFSVAGPASGALPRMANHFPPEFNHFFQAAFVTHSATSQNTQQDSMLCGFRAFWLVISSNL